MGDYLSTVVKSGQVNTPPGSYLTLKEWALNSYMNQLSNVLEVGCSTGFISIELARYTKANTIGIDLHEKSIFAARQNIDPCVANLVSFRQSDAGALPFEENTFSHVVVSGHLPFIAPELRRQHIIEAIRVLKGWAYLLVALYYYVTPPPQQLVDRFNQKIGTRLSSDGNKAYWSGLFDKLPLTI